MASELETPAKKARLDCDAVPVFHALGDFVEKNKLNGDRYVKLAAKFEEQYGKKSNFIARAPGRVNIIGEHIDYSGYAVLPMAIEQDITLVCRRNEEQILRLSNSCQSYSDYSCTTQSPVEIEGLQWYCYFLCGYKGVVEDIGVENPTGIDILVEGDVPPSAGLSSSSALVCCAALATAFANGINLPSKKDFAELCAKAERYIGSEGGGMDQAISFLGERNKAMLIEFDPIHLMEVQLPLETVFVISHTRVQKDKAAFISFKERVAECRIAAMVLAKANDLSNWREIRQLLPLQKALGQQLSQMPEVVALNLHKETYTRQEVCELLGFSPAMLESECLSSMTKDMQSFHLYKRAMHVFSEAERVYQFKETTNVTSANEDTAAELGRLMDASHTSCSQLYECSCPELDQLVALCKKSGALGSRLTGAGWGGCAVSLVERKQLDAFLDAVREGYFADQEQSTVSRCLFATAPGAGAAICSLRQ